MHLAEIAVDLFPAALISNRTGEISIGNFLPFDDPA